MLYQRGLSTGDFRDALGALLERRRRACRLQHRSDDRRLGRGVPVIQAAGPDREGVWADGVHFRVRLEDDRLCTLVLLGVRSDGTKELIAVEDGYRESAESWSSVLRDLKRRGLRAPVLAVGDGALGLRRAVRDVWPDTKEQRCWVHRLKNVLDKLPKRLQEKAKRALYEIMYADCREDAEVEIERFAENHGTDHPIGGRVVAERLRLPTQRPWQRLRTTKATESTFATVQLCQRVTKGVASLTGLAGAFKLLDMAQERLATGHRATRRSSDQRWSTVHVRNLGQERRLIRSSTHKFRPFRFGKGAA